MFKVFKVAFKLFHSLKQIRFIKINMQQLPSHIGRAVSEALVFVYLPCKHSHFFCGDVVSFNQVVPNVHNVNFVFFFVKGKSGHI